MVAGEKIVLEWGKHAGKLFGEAWLDQNYVKWCCEHMNPQGATGNRQAWLNYLSTRMAAEVEALDADHPQDRDTTTTKKSTNIESVAESDRRIAELEARVRFLEQAWSRLMTMVAAGIEGDQLSG